MSASCELVVSKRIQINFGYQDRESKAEKNKSYLILTFKISDEIEL